MKQILIIISFCTVILSAQEKSNFSSDSTFFKKTKLEILEEDIDFLISNPDLSGSLIGISVLSLESGEYLYNRNYTKNFIPASTNKLFTTAFALEYLGEAYNFKTYLYLDGEIQESGEFFGNIIIRGLGDPTFSKVFIRNPIEIIEKWAEKLDSIGITSIRGNIIGDDDFFDNLQYGRGWAWDDMNYSYSAQVSALSFNDNKVDITIIEGDTVDSPTHYIVYPPNSYVRVINTVKTSDSKQPTDINFYREPNTNIIEVSGTIAYDSSKINKATIAVTIDNPTLFFLNVFKEILDLKQIRFRGALLDIDDLNYTYTYTELSPFIEHQSISLGAIIGQINKFSNNLASEMILKSVSGELLGLGSYENSANIFDKFLIKCGIPSNNISFIDGSGLSRQNLNSPKYIITLLSYIYRSDYKDTFYNSLAVPGEPGTLERRMKKSLAEQSVVGKTGSLNNISNIAGYLRTKDDELLAYSIMFQNFTVPQTYVHNIQDLILMRLAGFSKN